MKYIIKKDYHFSYPQKIRDWQFEYVNSQLHPQLLHWTVLLLGPDGELYAMKKDHVKAMSPLEVVL